MPRLAFHDMTSAPTVIVAGEQGAGKGAVVRGLLGADGMPSVDRDAAPGAYVVYRYGDRPHVRAFIPGYREPRELAAGELAACARPPRRIEVAGPIGPLQAFTVVDTPAVAAVDPVYAEVAASAVGHDDVLVFVADAGRPL